MNLDPRRLRYNKEYFGYIVGLPEGEVVLTKDSAGPLLAEGASRAEIEPHFLPSFEIHKGFHLETPPLVWLELTRRCNLHCDHCYIDGGKPRLNELSTRQIEEIIDELAEMGVWAVAVTGGEPTLHPDFVQLINRIHEKGMLVGIATNGTKLTSRMLDQLPQDGVIISISLDDQHLRSKHEDSDFDRATEAILLCQKMGFATNIMTNTHRLNIGKLDQIIGWGENNGVSVRSVPFSPLGRGKAARERYENVVGDVAAVGQFWLHECQWEHEYHKKVGLCVGVIFNYGLSMAYMTKSCSSGRYLAYIAADGTIFPCTMCAGENILSPGKIAGRGFASIWRGNWEIRNYGWDNFSSCSTCILSKGDYYCSSRCPAMSYARHGEMFECGASAFETASTVFRTALLESSKLADETGQPLASKQG